MSFGWQLYKLAESKPTIPPFKGKRHIATVLSKNGPERMTHFGLTFILRTLIGCRYWSALIISMTIILVINLAGSFNVHLCKLTCYKADNMKNNRTWISEYLPLRKKPTIHRDFLLVEQINSRGNQVNVSIWRRNNILSIQRDWNSHKEKTYCFMDRRKRQ